jgi:hypothetical protein
MLFSLNLQNQIAQTIVNYTTSNAEVSLVLYSGVIPNTCEEASTDLIIATLNLTLPCFFVTGNNRILQTSYWTGTIAATGTVGYFRFINTANGCQLQGTVGFAYETVWQNNTFYSLGATVLNGSEVFECVQTGISSTTGTGPNSPTNGIQDGTAYWNYIGPGGDLNFVLTSFVEGDFISINQFELDIGNSTTI